MLNAVPEAIVVIQNVLVALDFSDVSDAAFVYARALARQFNARLHVLHVAENDFWRPTTIDPHELDTAVWRQLANRLMQEVARLGGDLAHVNDEAIHPKHDDVAGEAWLHGRFRYVLYRRSRPR